MAMTRTALFATLSLAIGASACHRTQSTTEGAASSAVPSRTSTALPGAPTSPTAARAASASGSNEAASAASPPPTSDVGHGCAGYGASEPVFRDVPCVSPRYDAHYGGYSKDGAWFAHCAVDGDTAPHTCVFENTRTGERKNLASVITYDTAPHVDEIDRFRAAKGFTTTTEEESRKLVVPWPYPDMRFAVEGGSQPPKAPVVKVGARIGDEAPVYPIVVNMPAFRAPPRSADATETPEQWALEFSWHSADAGVVSLSPDGKELGVIVFETGTMWAEATEARRMKLSTFATRVYNETGLAMHASGKHAGAAELFAKALEIEPTSSLFAYNVACAYAKADDARAEAALAVAIKLGGGGIRSRAANDDDFAGVRAAPWFRALVRRADR